ncbi:hypothetical protein ACTXT7_014825 [Hymenolepis weldensis]
MEPFIQDGQYISSYYHPLGLQNYKKKLENFVFALKEADENIRKFEEVCLQVSRAFLKRETGHQECLCYETTFLLDYEDELGLLAPYSHCAQCAIDILSFVNTNHFFCDNCPEENNFYGEIYTISDELWSDIMKKYPHMDCFLEDFQPGMGHAIFVFFKYRFLIPDQLEITDEPCQQTEDSSSVTESSMSEYVESE